MKFARTLAVVLLLAGCATKPHPQPSIAPKLIGTWRAATAECQDDFTFAADGTFNLDRLLTEGKARVKGNGIWRVDGNLLEVRFSDSTDPATDVPAPANFNVTILKIEPDTLVTTQMGSEQTIIARRLK